MNVSLMFLSELREFPLHFVLKEKLDESSRLDVVEIVSVT